MKRVLLIILCCFNVALFAQETQPWYYYQLRNNGFEEWETVSSGSVSGLEPVYWNSHIDNQGGFADMARAVQIERSEVIRPGSVGSYSCMVFPRKVLFSIMANGLITTGRVNAGDMSASNPNNHNVTLQENSDFNAPFKGRPDSLIFWAKFTTTNASYTARVNAFIHSNFNCTDPLGGASGSPASVVAQADTNFTRGDQGWNRYSVSFDYSHPNDNPQYLLITCSTNSSPGTGLAADRLYFDDIEMVYNCFLTDLTVGGVTVSGFNPNIFEYNYYHCSDDPYPSIGGTGALQVFNAQNVSLTIDQSPHNPSPTITVRHAGWHPDSSRVYTVNFIPIPSPSLPQTEYTRCGQGQVTLTATPSVGVCRWYTSSSGGTPVWNGNEFTTPSLSNHTTYYVSTYSAEHNCESARVPVVVKINPLPQITSSSGATRCGAGSVNLSATANNDATTCRWYATNSSSEILATGTSYSPEVSLSRSFFVAAYNANTTCESARTEVAVTINPAVGIPEVVGDTRCGEGEVTLTTTVGDHGDFCRWYISESAENPFTTGDSYTNSFSSITTYYVSSYNSTTSCESQRVAVTAVVNPLPAMPTIENIARCGGGEVTFIPTPIVGATFRWFSAGDAFLTTADSYTIDLETTATFKVRSLYENTGCVSDPVSVTATVNAIPSTPNVGNSERCGGGSITLSAAVGENGTECRWYSTLDAENASFTGELFSPVIENTTTYFVSSYNTTTQCESDRVSVTAAINAIPATPDINSTTLCGAGDILLTPSNPQENINYIWYSENENPLDTAQSYSSEIEETTFFKVLSYDPDTECKSAIVTISVKVNPVYDITLPEVTVCEEYIWNGTTYSESGLVYNIFETTEGCDSVVSFNLMVHQPTFSTIYDTVCMGVSYTENGFNIPAHTKFGDKEYERTMEGENSFSCDSTIYLHLHVLQSYTESQTVSVCAADLPYEFHGEEYLAGTHTIKLTAANGCDSIITLIVKSLVTPEKPTISLAPARCGEGEVQLVVSRGSNGAGCYWYSQQESDEIINTGTNYTIPSLESSTTFWVSTYHSNGCESERIAITATINPIPVSPVVHNSTLCGSDEVVLKAIPGQNGDNCRWYNNLTGGNPFLTDTTHTVGVSGAYYVTSYNSATGCESSPRVPITSTINPIPGMPAIAITRYCEGGEVVITPEMGADGNMINWYSDLDGSQLLQSSLSITAHLEQNSSYTYYISSSNSNTSCESAIQVVVIDVYQNYVIEEDIEECGSYTWFETTYTQSGTYTHNMKTIQDCDSTFVLNLTILEVANHQFSDFACGSYTWNGTEYTSSGTHQQTFPGGAANGCDSMVTLLLTIYPEYAPDTIREMICESASYNFFGRILVEEGIYDTIIKTQHGCDSLVVLDLTVSDAFHTPITKYICDGDFYLFAGEELTSPGVYRDTLTSVIGCDSIIILTLLMNPVYDNITLEIDICEGESYLFNNINYRESISVTHTFTTISGCDSTVTLDLTVNPVNISTIVDTICRGENYMENGFDLPVQEVAGLFSYFFTETNEDGCQDTVKLELLVNEAYFQYIDTVICANQMPLEYYGEYLNETGEHTFSFPTATGCDSIIIVNITINPVYRDTIYEYTCENVPFVFDENHTFTEEGVWEIPFESVSGCDSVIVLSLSLYPVYDDIIETVSICDNQIPYFWGDRNIYVEGQYSHTFTSVNGCDSAVTLNLIINNYYTGEDLMTVCSSQLPVNYGDSIFETAGVYDIIFTTQDGCDSVITLTLNVKESYATEFDANVCDFYIWNGITYQSTGTYTQTLTANNSCDSVVTLHLIIREKVFYEFSEIACSSYTWNETTYNTSGDYEQTFIADNGCDSIVTLHLTVNQPTSSTIYDEICQGELYEQNGFTINTNEMIGLYEESRTILNSVGCDSVIFLKLTVNPVYDLMLEPVTACVDYYWNNTLYNESGLVTHTFNTVHGCDSTVSFQLTINQPTSSTVYAIVCQGVLYNENGFTIATEEIVGLYEEELIIENGNSVGCDSVIFLKLTVNPVYQILLDPVTACSEYTWNDSTYTETTLVTHTFTTANSCDSTVSFQLTINYPTTSTVYDTICQGETYTVNGFDLPAYNVAGSYEEELVLSNANVNNCDSTVYLMLTVNPVVESQFVDEACEFYVWNGTTYNSSGDHVQTLTTSLGCDSVVTLHLTIHQSSPETVIYDNCCQYEFYTANGFDLPRQLTQGTFTHELQLENNHGCDSIVTLHLTVNPSYSTTVAESVCNSYTWSLNGVTYTESGSYEYATTTIHGCDSIVTLNLTIRQSSPITYLQGEICQGESYNEYGFSLEPQNEAGVFGHTRHLNNSQNCDSTIILELTVNPTYFIQLRDTVRPGETYSENGFYIETVNQGIYLDTIYLSTIAECDSTVMLILHVIPGSGIELNSQNNEIVLYPNPATNAITISACVMIEQVDIFDLSGKLFRTISVEGSKMIHCQIDDYPAGLYFVKITTAQGTQTKKLVITK